VNIAIPDLYQLIEESFQNNKTVVISLKGKSMYPFLFDAEDKIMLEKATIIKKRDIVLYLRDNGNFVVHRVIKIKGDNYYITGDNQYKLEIVKRENIKGKVIQLIHLKKTILVSNKWYRFKVYLWCLNLFVRRCILKIMHTFSKKGTYKQN
jgi:SOS-response transcriptional repressor LexA